MVTSSTSNALNQPTTISTSITGESGSTIVLFKPDDQPIISSQSNSGQLLNTQQQESIERPIEQQTSQQVHMKPCQTSATMETTPIYSMQKQDLLDTDSNAKNIQQQRQHHNQQSLNAAILANRSIEMLSADNEHVLFRTASSGDTASIAKLQHDGLSLLTLGNQ